jgi:hypothetical protein
MRLARPTGLVYPKGRTISYNYATANGIKDVLDGASSAANVKLRAVPLFLS